MSDKVSPGAARLAAEIAALAALPDAQQPLKAQLAEKEQQLAALQLQTGGVNLGVGTVIGQTGDLVAGDKIGGDQVLRDKFVNNFFGGAAGEADLPRQRLLDTAAQFFAAYDPARDYERAQIFCNYISRTSNGVLQQHGPATYRFPHRTFQEFLAARRLISDGDWDQPDFALRAKVLAGSAQWREVLLLAVSQLALKEQTRDAAGLVDELLEQHESGTSEWARNVTLAGELLAEVGHDRLVRLGARTGGLWDETIAALVRVLQGESGGTLPLDVAGRVRAGTVLGLLGDIRPGVCTLEPDWCVVLAGPFLLGSTDQDEQARNNENLSGRSICPVSALAATR